MLDISLEKFTNYKIIFVDTALEVYAITIEGMMSLLFLAFPLEASDLASYSGVKEVVQKLCRLILFSLAIS